jgi:transposase
MRVPGVGPKVALAFQSTIDTPIRFKNSKAVGAVLGLTPVLHQSCETNRIGNISRCGNGMAGTLLYEAAQVLLTCHSKWSWLKAWAIRIAQHRGRRKRLWRWRAGLL